jgi:membrane protein DedA with SNARE-associated domain
LDAFLQRLAELPPALLYLALAVTAAIENFFPPFPADTVVAFGSFYAARVEGGSPILSFLATWGGNVAGAMGVYALGRRFGAGWLQKKFGDARGQGRIEEEYRRRGVPALFLSRFLPGVRTLVPPVAGALKVPPLRAALAIGLASAIWYGAITVLAYRVGESWEELAATISRMGRWMALVAAVVVAVVAIVWWIRRKRA